MRRPASVYIVYDRQHRATREREGLVQLVAQYNNARKYYSTGVKVRKQHWNAKRMRVEGLPGAEALNERIDTYLRSAEEYITSCAESGREFSFEGLERVMRHEDDSNESFLDFAQRMIATREDIRESTRKTQRKLIASLMEFGRIRGWETLTRQNIIAYDDFLKGKGIRQATVHSYHKWMKTYIHEAIRRELTSYDPYVGMKISRGDTGRDKWLTEDEFNAVCDATMPTQSLERVRDLFVLQCLTGLAYSDLMDFDVTKIKQAGGDRLLTGRRMKTGVDYCVYLLPEAEKIISKYGVLPRYSNVQYNLRLKAVAQCAGVDKPISSHWGRRTCGMLLLNRGVSMETVSRVLGHQSIKTTESIYARILPSRVAEEMKSIAAGKEKKNGRTSQHTRSI